MMTLQRHSVHLQMHEQDRIPLCHERFRAVYFQTIDIKDREAVAKLKDDSTLCPECVATVDFIVRLRGSRNG